MPYLVRTKRREDEEERHLTESQSFLRDPVDPRVRSSLGFQSGAQDWNAAHVGLRHTLLPPAGTHADFREHTPQLGKRHFKRPTLRGHSNDRTVCNSQIGTTLDMGNPIETLLSCTSFRVDRWNSHNERLRE